MTYKRKPPALAIQVLNGLIMDVLAPPFIRWQERRGSAVRLFGRFATGQHARLRRKNPFHAYVPGPQDVFVSNYHFIRDGVYGPAMPSVETWLELFLSPKFPIGGSWAVNTAGYWAERQKPNVLIASFKEMKRDLRGTVLTVADFLKI